MSALPLLLSTSLLAAVGDESAGINVHVATPANVAAALDLGVRWIRIDGNWLSLQPARGRYEFAEMDAQVTRATRAGLSVFLTLGYTPSWVPRHGDTDGNSGNDVPDTATEWSAFVREVVARYRPMGVRHFGLWNEANLRQFWEGSLAEYSGTIANPGAAAVRAACSDCFVLGPDLASVGDSDDALEAVLAATRGTWDIVTHHIYQGFRETGTQIWDGDSYINILDQQRLPGTRRPLRQLLDAVGWTGEVWITETGFQADPPGDARREATQATYVRRALEEQAARAWLTNTFFYEIQDCGPDQPACPIDGFGLLRGTAGQYPTRRYPQDFRVKPAFLEVQRYLAANAQFARPAPPAACSNGTDDDRDGRIDAEDRGCSGETDADEGDDPPRQTLTALGRAQVAFDTDHAEYAGSQWVRLADDTWRSGEPLGAGDLGVRAAALWTEDDLYLAFEVEDDVHDNTRPLPELWQGDSVQLAFDLSQDSRDAYDARDDHELNFALDSVTGVTKVFRFHGPAGVPDDFSLTARRTGATMRYELRVGASALGLRAFSAGLRPGFSFLVNDADGRGRAGWKEWTRGIGQGKQPYWYGQLELLPRAAPPDAGVRPDAGAVDAGAVDAGAVEPVDAAARDGGAVDAGAVEPVDAAAPEDAGASDAGRRLAPPAEPAGCGCHATGDLPGGASLLLAAVAALCLRRRRP